jgi:hypothetical protein
VIVVPPDDYTCSSIGVFPVPKGAGAAPRASAGTGPAVWGPEPGHGRIRLPRQDRAAMAAGQSFAGWLRRLLADSVRLLEAGQDPVGRGEGCDFARITAASQVVDATRRGRTSSPRIWAASHEGVDRPGLLHRLRPVRADRTPRVRHRRRRAGTRPRAGGAARMRG